MDYTPLVLDVGCGLGGVSLGLRAAQFRAVGLSNDPVAVHHYRLNVGPCALTTAYADVHLAPGEADVVAADLPPETKSWGQRPDAEMDETPAGNAWHVVRLAVEAQAPAVVFGWHRARGERSIGVTKLKALLHSAGYLTRDKRLCYADYGAACLKCRHLVVGLRPAGWAQAWRWAEPTHRDGARRNPWVTARQAIGVPYDRPSPTFSSMEHEGRWGGGDGGRWVTTRAVEIMAIAAGRAAWGERPVKLTPYEILTCLGFPPYTTLTSSRFLRFLLARASSPLLWQALGGRLRWLFEQPQAVARRTTA